LNVLRCALPVVWAIGLCAPAWAGAPWKLTRNPHFYIYSQGSDASARSALQWFEQLRGFFLQQTGLTLDHLPAVRVIAFGSPSEYAPYRLRSADAYYVGAEAQDYIVMPGLGSSEFHTAAHEYAHLILHASGLRYPDWLKEGLAEFFSTVHVSESGSGLGGDLPARSQLLRRHAWMPLSDLLALPEESVWPADRERAGLFYAQSWALTDMLFLSAEYGPHFPELVAALSFGAPGSEALTKVYAKPLDQIMRDLHAWVDGRGSPPIHLPGVAAPSGVAEVSDVSEFASRSLLAELLMATGELDRAEALYRDLDREAPGNADIAAALGTIALRRGDDDGARREWKRAIRAGVTDARLCYRYAVLAGVAGLSDDEVRPALERAVELRPDFDDARYLLALLEKNASHYETAVTQLRAMRRIAPGRQYDYWSILSDALNELHQYPDAKAAADQASRYATSPTQRARAAQLAYMAQTDLAVQFVRDSSGRAQMVTTRVPHESDWNPFIEAGDDMRQVQGSVKEIDCGGDVTRFVVEAGGQRLKLTIEDPSRVRMRNAPPEFVCGSQEANYVLVEYAVSKNKGTDGLIRGVEFR
jgi:tetratricopeptide (TPR) repeat protein